MFIKVCGITRRDDAMHAVEHGATALGFILWPGSARFVEPERVAQITAGVPDSVMKIGVFVNERIESLIEASERAGLTTVQLHGDETPEYAETVPLPVVRALGIDQSFDVWTPGVPLLLDATSAAARGGTGQTVDWVKAAAIAQRRKVILAGGLTPANVCDAIATVRPFGVDVSSGVEASPGVKDPAKVAEFLARARDAYRTRGEQARGSELKIWGEV